MVKKTEVELQKALILKTVRAAIRLKHALAADTELNEKLPAMEARIDRLMSAGLPCELDIGEILDEA